MKNGNRKKKNLISLGILAVVITVSVILWAVLHNSSTIKQNIHIENVQDISKITINDTDGGILVLEKQNDSTWTVNKDFEANKTLINTILETFAQMRIREPLPKAARNNVIKDLATDSKKVDVYTTDYLIHIGFIKLFKREHLKQTYHFGHETPDEMGTFMLRKGDDTPYIVYIPNFRGYLSTRFSTVQDLWRTHNVFKYKQSEIDNIKIELPSDNKENYTLVNNGKGFSFVNAQGITLNEFDTSKVVALLSSFVEMNYERIAKNISKIEQDTIFSREPSFIITVKDKKGNTQWLKTFVKLSDPNSIAKDESDFYNIFDINRCYALSSKYSDTLVMQFYTLDNVLKPASYFLPGAEGVPFVK